MPYAEINGCMTYYEVAGEGPPLTLLHAAIADSRMWDRLFERFAGRHKTIRLDLRGFGRSELPPGPYLYADDVVALLDELEVERTTLVGVSMGGGVALQLALDRPELVSALVLAAAALPGHEWSQGIKRYGEEEEALLDAGDIDGATDLNVRTWVDGPEREPSAVDTVVRERVRSMQRQAFETQTRAHSQPQEPEPQEPPGLPAAERLPEIAVPALVVTGALDQPDFTTIGQRLASEIPGARHVVFERAAHMLALEEPDRFAELVLGFLASA